jgi:hypothetical protein
MGVQLDIWRLYRADGVYIHICRAYVRTDELIIWQNATTVEKRLMDLRMSIQENRLKIFVEVVIDKQKNATDDRNTV